MLGYLRFCYQFYRTYLAILVLTLAVTIVALIPDALSAKYILAVPAFWFWAYAMFSSRQVLRNRKEMLAGGGGRRFDWRTRAALGLVALLSIAVALLMGVAWLAVVLWYAALIPGGYVIWHEYNNSGRGIDL